MQVPALSVGFMALSCLISIVLPVVLYIVFRKRFGSKFLPVVIGAGAFILFAMVLEQIAHMLILRPDASGNTALLANPFLYALYGGLAAGVFEETGRLAAFRLFRRKIDGVENALSYGVGHGGIEAILLVGLTMVSNLMLSALMNEGMGEAMLTGLAGDELLQAQAGMTALASTPSHMFLLGGLERIFAMTTHIALSVIVFYALSGKGRIWLYFAAIGMHALINIPAGLMQAGALTNVYVVEALTALFAALYAGAALFVHRRFRAEPEGAIHS